MNTTLDPISAVTSENPYPYYAKLAQDRPYAYDDALKLWVAASREKVLEVLADRTLRVRPFDEPVPSAVVNTPVGAAFARFARFTDGDEHVHVRATVDALFDRFDQWHVAATANLAVRAWIDTVDPSKPTFLSEIMYGVPALAVAALLGLPTTDQTLDWVKALVGALRANATGEAIALGSDGVMALAHALGTSALDTTTVNRIGLLFQSYDATAGLIGNVLLHRSRGEGIYDLRALVERVIEQDPSVHNTRRYGRDRAILVVLAAADVPFGSAAHYCPARALATEITFATCSYLLASGLRLEKIKHEGYVPSPNCRIPRLVLG